MDKVLKEMLERATDPQSEALDETAVDVFILVIRDNPQLVIKGRDLIFEKLRSSNELETIKAVKLLDECMNKGSIEFQNEMTKKRSLNMLTSLVLNKHEGENTPLPTKQRILQCVQMWTVNFPKKEDIRVVYDVLSKKFEIENGIVPSSVSRRDNPLEIDEQQLIKLIKSNDPLNYERANLLIQHSVHQEERRTELRMQQQSKLEEIKNTVGLLNQMLDTFEIERSNNVNETIQLLYRSCKVYLKIDFNECFNEVCFRAEALRTKKILNEVLQRYKILIEEAKSRLHSSPTSSSTSSVISITNAATNGTHMTSENSATTDLLTSLPIEPLYQLAAASLPTQSTITTNFEAAATSNFSDKPKVTSANALDELSDIFSSVVTTTTTTTMPTESFREFFNIQLLEPVKVSLENDDGKNANNHHNQSSSEKRTVRDLPEIDVLSEKLLKKNLPGTERVGTFKKALEKSTLNDLVKEKTFSKSTTKSTPTTPTPTTTPTQGSTPVHDMRDKTSNLLNIEVDSIFKIPPSDHQMDEKVKNTMLDSSLIKNDSLEVETKTPIQEVAEMRLKSLSELNIALEDVIPSGEERIILDDDDIKIMLSFTKNSPSPGVTVFVFVIHNKSQLPLSDFQLEVSVKKPNKVRLLPATDSKISPYKLFPPSIPIYQMLLLLNPTKKAVDLTCLYGYKLGDDPDGIKDVVIAPNIDFLE